MNELLILDNYDSFTYNLAQAFGRYGVPVRIVRADAVSVDALCATPLGGLVISAGPGTPERAGNSVRAVRALSGKVPILGVCLGHQAIGSCFGARIIPAPIVVHGKTSEVDHSGDELFAGIPSPFFAMRYHSLVLEASTLPAALNVTARSPGDGVVMAVAHGQHRTYGVQFHPESVLTRHGPRLLKNFLCIAGLAP